jgi:hypothetical protein
MATLIFVSVYLIYLLFFLRLILIIVRQTRFCIFKSSYSLGDGNILTGN